jgi:hypothetical protein
MFAVRPVHRLYNKGQQLLVELVGEPNDRELLRLRHGDSSEPRGRGTFVVGSRY